MEYTESLNEVLKRVVEKPAGPGYEALAVVMAEVDNRPIGVTSISSSTLNRIARGTRVPTSGEREWVVHALEKLAREQRLKKLDRQTRQALLEAPFVPASFKVDAARQRQTLLDFVTRVEKYSVVSGLYGPRGPRASSDPSSLSLIYILILHGECTMRFFFRPMSEDEWPRRLDPWHTVVDVLVWMSILAHKRMEQLNFDLAQYCQRVNHEDASVVTELGILTELASALINSRPSHLTIDGRIIRLLLSKVAIYCPAMINRAGPVFPEITTYFLTEPPISRAMAPASIAVDVDDGYPTLMKNPMRLRDFFNALQGEPNALQRIDPDKIIERAKELGITLQISD